MRQTSSDVVVDTISCIKMGLWHSVFQEREELDERFRQQAWTLQDVEQRLKQAKADAAEATDRSGRLAVFLLVDLRTYIWDYCWWLSFRCNHSIYTPKMCDNHSLRWTADNGLSFMFCHVLQNDGRLGKFRSCGTNIIESEPWRPCFIHHSCLSFTDVYCQKFHVRIRHHLPLRYSHHSKAY